MEGKSAFKIPEGKLVKIELGFLFGKIKTVKINGDFFIHPEEGIEQLEKSLNGIALDNESICAAIDNAAKKNSLQLYGVTAEGIAEAIMLAKENAKQDQGDK
jgi:lipoate-protein ligase A